MYMIKYIQQQQKQQHQQQLQQQLWQQLQPRKAEEIWEGILLSIGRI